MSLSTFKNMSKNMGLDIIITHVPTGKTVQFPSFVTEFSDKYAVSWGSETIFGRNDQIKPYQGTTRDISVTFEVISENLQSAKINHSNASLLGRMMYPVYSQPLSKGRDTGRIIKAPPLWRIKYGNLIQSTTIKGGTTGLGLLGTIGGFSYSPPIMDDGAYVSDGQIIPKRFSVSFSFTVLHEDTVGWDVTGNFLQDQYPYGAETPRPSAASAETAGRDSTGIAAAAVDQATGQ